jgi:hypothetical protein
MYFEACCLCEKGFQFLDICLADDGFVGRYEAVEPRAAETGVGRMM